MFDKKVNNLKQKIQVVEYCSLLGLKDSKYSFTKEREDNPFLAISCVCMDKDFFTFSKTIDGPCTHSPMVSDTNLIKFVENYLQDKDYMNITEDRKTAVQNYKAKFDYEDQCNIELKGFSDQGL